MPIRPLPSHARVDPFDAAGAAGAAARAAGPVHAPSTGARLRRLTCGVLAALMAWGGPVPSVMAQARTTGDGAAAAAAARGNAGDGVRLPALGESASEAFNLSQEKAVGAEVMRSIRQDAEYLDDPLLLAYLHTLWAPLVEAARAQGDIRPDTDGLFPYEVFLVGDRSVNAFALPGGYVGVYLGLIAMTGTGDELASVLAHELSHVTQRHIARRITGASRDTALGMAALLLGIVLAARTNNPDVAQAAVMVPQGAMAQGQLNFSRDMEREADRSGFRLMMSAGYAPRGMAAMFDRLAQKNRLNDDGAYPYLRSHPLTIERIGEASQRVEALRDPHLARPLVPTLLHELMRTRAQVLMDPSVLALRRLQGLDQVGRRSENAWGDRLVAHLGAALASSRLQEFDRAARDAAAARELLAAPPADAAPDARTLSVVHLTLAELALARGDAATARQALDASAAAWGSPRGSGTAAAKPGIDRPSLLLRAELALTEGRPVDMAEARGQLQTWLADHRLDPSAWLLESRFAERQGQQLRAVRAQAEARAGLGDLRGAIARMRAGRQLARQGGQGLDFIEASVIEARLRELETEQQALRDEAEREQRGRRSGDDGAG